MKASSRWTIAIAAALAICSCAPRELAPKPGPSPTSPEIQPETKGPDPRAAFESSCLLGGMTASPEAPVVLVAASGIPEAGVSISLGAALSTAAVARRYGPSEAGGTYGHELVLASGARISLRGPALAMAAVGERILVACAGADAPGRASLTCYRTEGEGERLIEAWSTEGPPATRLLPVPGGRVAAADEAASLELIDPATGAVVWSQGLPSVAADIAYAPGLVLAAAGSSLAAYDESSGALVWNAALTSKARSLSAGTGVALVLAESGSLSAFSLGDGKGIGAATGPFDASLRPVADGARAIAALVGGGAAEIDVKSGQTTNSWSWEGTTAFLAADRDRVYSGLDGRSGRGVLVCSRAGEPSRRIASLPSPAFDAPAAVNGARGGLLLALMDGSLVLVGTERAPSAAASALDAAVAPPYESAKAISTAIGRFKAEDSAVEGRYLRFDLFAQGMPVDTGMDFTAFRYDCLSSSKRSFYAKPANLDTVIAIFDESGREMAASIDELGSSSSASGYLEKGRVYWIVAGWTYKASPESFRLYIK
jgi:hypothetical protein